jgi:hypothetical protein
MRDLRKDFLMTTWLGHHHPVRVVWCGVYWFFSRFHTPLFSVGYVTATSMLAWAKVFVEVAREGIEDESPVVLIMDGYQVCALWSALRTLLFTSQRPSSPQ